MTLRFAAKFNGWHDSTTTKNNFRYFLTSIYVIRVDVRCRFKVVAQDIEIIKKNVTAGIHRDYMWAYARIRFGMMTENVKLLGSLCAGALVISCAVLLKRTPPSHPSLRISTKKVRSASSTTRRSQRITTARSSVPFICIQTTSRRFRST